MSSTIYDVAKLAGVSTATVSRVINQMGNVRPNTIEKVQVAMKALNFTPNSLAQSFSTNRSFTIGFVLSLSGVHQVYSQDTAVTSYYYTELFSAINTVLETKGYSLLIINSKDNMEKHLGLLLDQHRIDGLIIGMLPQNTESFRALIEKKSPIAYLGHIHQYDRGLRVYAQYNQYLNKVLQYFSDRGHQKILFICVRDSTTLIKEWDDLNYQLHHTLDISFIPAEYDNSTLSEIIKREFSSNNPPTAIFCELLSDVPLIISNLHHLGLSIPENVSLISIEQTKDAGLNYYPPLTNIYVPVYKMGKCAIHLLLDYIDNKLDTYDHQLDIESYLVERNSVRDLTTIT